MPGNLWEMGMENFARELAGIRTSTRFQDFAVMRAALPKNALVSALFAVHVAFAKGLGKIDLMLEVRRACCFLATCLTPARPCHSREGQLQCSQRAIGADCIVALQASLPLLAAGGGRSAEAGSHQLPG